MKKLLILGMLLVPALAQARTECAGETYGGTLVRVAIETMGVMGSVKEGRVDILSGRDGQTRSYAIRPDEVTQYFEFDNQEAQPRSVVGLAAFVNAENPVTIHYVGTNFARPVLDVIRQPLRMKEPGNEMRVWKGPGYASDQQHQFTDVVCRIVLDP